MTDMPDFTSGITDAMSSAMGPLATVGVGIAGIGAIVSDKEEMEKIKELGSRLVVAGVVSGLASWDMLGNAPNLNVPNQGVGQGAALSA